MNVELLQGNNKQLHSLASAVEKNILVAITAIYTETCSKKPLYVRVAASL